MPEEFPAVMVPVLENTGWSLAIFSSVAPRNGCSSLAKVVAPFLPSITTGAIHVHGVGGTFFRNAAADGNLPGDIGPAPGLPRIAENGLLHLLARHSGALQRCPGRNRAHIRRRLRGQRAAKFADRRANGGEDENFPHLFSLAY